MVAAIAAVALSHASLIAPACSSAPLVSAAAIDCETNPGAVR
jgi:hypothetical protein